MSDEMKWHREKRWNDGATWYVLRNHGLLIADVGKEPNSKYPWCWFVYSNSHIGYTKTLKEAKESVAFEMRQLDRKTVMQ